MAEPRWSRQLFRAQGVASIKRSTAIALILLGTGTAAYVAAMHSRVCHNDQGEEVPCRSSGSRGHSSSYWGYASGASNSSGATTSNARPAATTVARGGFGSTASGMHSGG